MRCQYPLKKPSKPTVPWGQMTFHLELFRTSTCTRLGLVTKFVSLGKFLHRFTGELLLPPTNIWLKSIGEFSGWNTQPSGIDVAFRNEAKRQFPQLEKPIDKAKTFCGHRPYVSDGILLLGPVNSHQNLFVSCGPGSNGWKLAMGSGEVIERLVSGVSVFLHFETRRDHWDLFFSFFVSAILGASVRGSPLRCERSRSQGSCEILSFLYKYL